MRVWARGRSAAVVALLLVQVSFAGPPQHKRIRTGSEADINAIGNRKVGHGPNFYSLDREITLGSQLARKVDRSAKFIDDPLVNEYVNRIGQNLVRDSDARLPFTFKVIDSEEVDAFALPGGFLYVNRGLILLADEEAELAGVLAHEIAHVCARHGTRNSTRSEIARVATMSLIVLGPGGWAGYAILTGLKVGVPLTFLKFSRSAESEADYLGLGPVWATPSKADADPPIGVDGLRVICAAVSSPVVAIGGIDETNAAECIRAGAAGVAVLRAARAAAAVRAAIDAAV